MIGKEPTDFGSMQPIRVAQTRLMWAKPELACRDLRIPLAHIGFRIEIRSTICPHHHLEKNVMQHGNSWTRLENCEAQGALKSAAQGYSSSLLLSHSREFPLDVRIRGLIRRDIIGGGLVVISTVVLLKVV